MGDVFFRRSQWVLLVLAILFFGNYVFFVRFLKRQAVLFSMFLTDQMKAEFYARNLGRYVCYKDSDVVVGCTS